MATTEKTPSPGISIIVPAFNEEANLEGTLQSIQSATKDLLSNFEVLLVDDCSTDSTLLVARRLESQFSFVRVIHHETNQGFGGAFKTGLENATKESVIIIPGDNEIAPHSIRSVLSQAGKADIVVPYTSNKAARSYFRRALSWAFTTLMNGLFGLHLKYYNGICILPTAATKSIGVTTSGFAYMAQLLVKLIKIEKKTYTEVGMEITPQKGRKTKAFHLSNILSVVTAIVDLKVSVSRELRKRAAAAHVTST